jgi:hypothetical protein
VSIVTELVALVLIVAVGLLLRKFDRSRPSWHKDLPEHSGISGFAGDGGDR